MRQPESKDFIDLNRIFRSLLRNWPLFVLVLILSLASLWIYLLVTPKQYQVISLLQLNDQSLSEKGTGNEKFLSGMELLEDNAEIEDEIGILSSNSLISETMDQLDFEVSVFETPTGVRFLDRRAANEIYNQGISVVLHENEPQVVNMPVYFTFDNGLIKVSAEANDVELYNISGKKKLKNISEISFQNEMEPASKFESEFLNFHFEIDPSFDLATDEKYFFIIHSPDDLVKRYRDGLSINRISKESNIVQLSILGLVPEKEQEFINMLMKLYIQNDLEKKNYLGVKTIEFIDSQLGSVQDSLISVESNLEYFRSATPIMDVSSRLTSLQLQKLNLEDERSELNTQIEYLAYTLENLTNDSDITEFNSPSTVRINDAYFNDLLIELSDLNKERIDRSFRSKESNPVIQVIDRKIENTKNQLIENINNMIKSTEIRLEENKDRLELIENEINSLPKSERSLANIERKFAFNDNIYNYLLQKKAEAAIALASNLPDKTIIDEARLWSKRPVKPNTKILLALVVLFSLLMPILILFIGNLNNKKIRSADDITELFGKPALAEIEDYSKKYAEKIASGSSEELHEQFKKLAVSFMNRELKFPFVLFVSSIHNSAGKSLCSMGLAKGFARLGLRTLVWDLTNDARDLNGTESTDIDIKDLIVDSEISNLYKAKHGFGSNTLVSQQGDYKMQMGLYRKYFNVVLIECLPIPESIQCAIISKDTDGGLIVVRSMETHKNSFVQSMSSLNPELLNKTEILLNDVKSNLPGHRKVVGSNY